MQRKFRSLNPLLKIFWHWTTMVTNPSVCSCLAWREDVLELAVLDVIGKEQPLWPVSFIFT